MKYKGESPTFCETKKPFDLNAILPLIERLTLEWTNDHANSGTNNSLWKHEWLAHGTCSLSINELNSEYRYFDQALDWHQQYNIFKYLQKFGILPGFDVEIWSVFEAIKESLGGISPALDCRIFPQFDQPILTNVGLCFDKKLRLIDCKPSFHPNGNLGNCPQEGMVYYPREEKNYRMVEGFGKVW